jgi:hypothetical protein
VPRSSPSRMPRAGSNAAISATETMAAGIGHSQLLRQLFGGARLRA